MISRTNVGDFVTPLSAPALPSSRRKAPASPFSALPSMSPRNVSPVWTIGRSPPGNCGFGRTAPVATTTWSGCRARMLSVSALKLSLTAIPRRLTSALSHFSRRSLSGVVMVENHIVPPSRSDLSTSVTR